MLFPTTGTPFVPHFTPNLPLRSSAVEPLFLQYVLPDPETEFVASSGLAQTSKCLFVMSFHTG